MNGTDVSVKISKKGRPAVNINWPSDPFTVEDVFNQADNRLTKVALQLRVKKAVTIEKTLVVKGTQKTTGRPRVIYERVPESTPSV